MNLPGFSWEWEWHTAGNGNGTQLGMGMAHSQNSAASMLAATPKRNKCFMDKKVISKKSLMNLPGFRWGGEGGAGTPILYPAFISLHNNISTDIRGDDVQLINLLPLIV